MNQIAKGVTSIDRQFSIKHLLLGTFLLAAALGLARRLPIGREIKLPDLAIDGELLTILVSVVVCNLILVVPTIWASSQQLRLLGVRSLVWCFMAFLVTITQFLLLCAALGDPGDAMIEIIWILFLVNVFQCVAVLVVMLTFRTYGCRLVWVKGR